MQTEQEQAWSSMNSNEQFEYLSLEQLDTTETPKKKGLNLGPMWRLVRRNILLIGFMTAAVTGATFALVWDEPRTYEGEFQLLVEPVTAEGRSVEPAALSRGEDRPAGKLDYSTLIQVLTSRSVLDSIIAQIKASYPAVTYNSISNALTVERLGQDSFNETKLIRVGYEAEDQQEILLVLEELKKGFLKFGLEDRKKHIGKGVAFIEEQLPELRQRVSTLESQLQALQQQSRISNPESEGEDLARRARELGTQRLETQRDLIAQQQVAADLERQLGLPLNQANSALSANELNEQPAIQDLDNQIREAELEIQNSPLTDQHPQKQELLQKRQNLKVARKQEVSKIVTPLATGQNNGTQIQLNSHQRDILPKLADALNEIRVLEIRAQAANQAAVVVDQELRQFPAIKRKYNELERNLQLATTKLEQRLLQYETLRVEAAQKDIPWQIPSEPDLLRDKNGNPLLSEQDRTKRLALGLLGGFLLGIGAALLRERQQDVFHNTEDVQEQTSASLLGTLPFNEAALELAPAEGNAENGNGTKTKASRAFEHAMEALYTKIRFLATDPPIRSVVISSAAPQDGKTTVAVHLAQAAATMGQRVLLVDTNLNVPKLHTQFEVPNFQGLSEILSQNLDPNQLIQRSPYHTNLSILTAGQSLPQAGKVLAGHEMQYLMEQLNDMFEFVIYDTPHLQSHSDANFVAANADGMLLVLGIGKTRHSQFVKTLEALRSKRLRVLGIVANLSGATSDLDELEQYEGYGEDYVDVDELEDEFEIFRVGPRA